MLYHTISLTSPEEDSSAAARNDADFVDIASASSKKKIKWRKKEEITNPSRLSSPHASVNDYLSQPIRGAVLGDEMGLGKSLTSLAVVWAILRQHKNCKAIIVVPSSLIDNWEKEIKKWLVTRLNPLCCRSGDKAESTLQNFRISHVAISPLLIISYELFRKNLDTINSVPKLELIVCDEGHRLKNKEATLTTTALKQCKANKRIILSGTLIQNDLAELYSVIDFVAPSYLGSYPSFKRKFEDPIKDAKEKKQQLSPKAEFNLQKLLSRFGLCTFTFRSAF